MHGGALESIYRLCTSLAGFLSILAIYYAEPILFNKRVSFMQASAKGRGRRGYVGYALPMNES